MLGGKQETTDKRIMKIIKTTIKAIRGYRDDYLNALPEFQELFIELMIAGSKCYLLKNDNEEIGYAIVDCDGILIEFYLKNKYLPQSNDFFKQVLTELSISEIVCKSFDAHLLNHCLANHFKYSVLGVLYRNYVEPLVKYDSKIKMVKADLESVGLLKAQDDSIKELFETEQQLIDFIQNENVFEFYMNDMFVGCGMVLRTHPDWDYCDLGVWVKPSERGNSLGAQILLSLRNFAIGNNLKSTCGCAIDNIASQKTIEKSGFVSKYKLINFKTK